MCLVIDCIRSMGEDNVFTHVCHSVHSRGGGECLYRGMVYPEGVAAQGDVFCRQPAPPVPRWPLPRSVRILLECILVITCTCAKTLPIQLIDVYIPSIDFSVEIEEGILKKFNEYYALMNWLSFIWLDIFVIMSVFVWIEIVCLSVHWLQYIINCLNFMHFVFTCA